MIVERISEFVTEGYVISLTTYADKTNITYNIKIEYNNMISIRESASIRDESKAKIIYRKLKEYIKKYGIPSNIEFDAFISSRL